jgi:hypothetical protein
MKSFYLLFIASFILLTGCQTKPFKSQAVQERENINLKIAAAQRNSKMCADELSLKDKYSIIDKEILATKPDNPAKYELMASTKFLNEEQKDIFKSFLAENFKCRQLYLSGFNGLPHYMIIMNSYNEFDANYLKLIAGELNIGQLNKLNAESMNTRISKLVAADRELDDRLRNSHEREVSAIQRKQEADRQYYLEYQRTMNQNNQSDPLAPLQQLLQKNQSNKPKQTDFACQQKCINQGSMYDFCEKACSY